MTEGNASSSDPGGCPYKSKPSSSSWKNPLSWFSTNSSSNSLPASIEESLNHSQKRIDPAQNSHLRNNRVVSSIPRGDTPTPSTSSCMKNSPVPSHQPHSSPHWVYPSEQQFYNAMRNKGHHPTPTDVPTILSIHNAVNERSWLHILSWEDSLHPGSTPKLVRFMGRPRDLSPKAFVNTYIRFYNPPFDRHDWFIDRGDGVERRYVIDFYKGSTENGMYLDVRPALDDVDAVTDRLRMGLKDVLPGIFGDD